MADATVQSSLTDLDQMQNLVDRVDGVNDERDSVPLLLEMKKLWPRLRAALEAHYPCSPHCAGYLREQKVTAALKTIAKFDSAEGRVARAALNN